MNCIQISAQKRNLSSKGYLNTLRKSGKVPGVLFGRDNYSLPLTVDSADLKKVMNTSARQNVLLNLEIDDTGSHMAMIENLQRNPLKDGVYLHVDFMLVSLDKKIDFNIPVILIGQDKRVNDDGIVSHPIHEVLLRSAPTSIPENIMVDISSMKIGDSIMLKDITLPEGCEAVTSLNEMLVSILHPHEGSDATEPAETAKPDHGVTVETPAK